MQRAKRLALLASLMLFVVSTAEAKPKPKPAKIEGTISAVSTNPATVTVQSPNGNLTLNVTGDTKIEIGDERATLADLRVGQPVEVKYDRQRLVALQIKVRGDDDEDEGEAVGEVVAVDENNGVLTLDLNNDGVIDLTLETTDQTEVKIGDLRLTAQELDLLEGLIVRVEYNPETFRVREIKADISRVRTVTGTVGVVDTTARTLSVQTQDGVLQLQVPADAEILVDGRSVRLSDVEPGDQVRVTVLPTGNNTGIALQVRVTEAPQPEPRTATGTITAIDPTARTLTLQTQDGPLQLQVPANSDIRLNGRSVSLADLEVGDTAQVTDRVNANGTNTALQIRATEAQQPEPRTATGTITAVNAAAGTLTLQTQDGPLQLQVPANADIRLDGRTATLADLEVGDTAQVTYRVNANGTNTVLRIRATSEQQPQPEPITVAGTITAVDVQARTLTVQTANGVLRLQVPADADIRLNGRSASLADLEVGDTVQVTYRANANGTNTALRIRATEAQQPQPQRRHVSGVLTDVDGSRFTVRTANGRTVVLTLNAETNIRINGREATAADLEEALNDATQAGRVVRISADYLADGETNVATRVQANARGRGRGRDRD